MIIFQVAAFALVSVFLVITLKDIKPEIAVLLSVLAGIGIFLFTISYLKSILTVLAEIADDIELDISLVGTMLKIVAIAYICEFSSQICRDAGVSSLASKVEFAGKILILFTSAPIVLSLLELLRKIV